MIIGEKRGLDKKGRRLFEKTYGHIPKGFHVHHKNGDHSNNSLDNLVLMRANNHLSLHSMKWISEPIEKNWGNRPIWARYRKLESGSFVSYFNDDGSYEIKYKPSLADGEADILSKKGDNFIELGNYEEALECFYKGKKYKN